MREAILASEIKDDEKEMRQAFCQSMIALAEENKDVVLLDADLMSAMGTKPFAKRFPERTVDCGVQEANMIGVACGLAVQGKIPFAHTFGSFATRRACDQVFLSGAYNKANVKIIGSDPGVTAAYNGGTHMPFEDMGIMRGIPTMTVIEPTDNVMLSYLIPLISAAYGIFYMRLVRKGVKKVYEEGSEFEIGKAVKLRDGKDATIVASGFCVPEALSAAQILAEQGINVRVLDMFTWKPIDEKAIVSAASETGAIVTAENHNIINGLGSAVAEVLATTEYAPLVRVGVEDEFGEVGPISYLRKRFGLTDEKIVDSVKEAIARKNS
ncbi:MAG TPA: transketolase family protein [Clostridiaceae bacterium]|nr:transketolase family protein [Clostridiaceae bacterium]